VTCACAWQQGYHTHICSQTAIGPWPHGPKGHSHTAVWPIWPCAHLLPSAVWLPWCASPVVGLAHAHGSRATIRIYAAKLPSAHGPMALRATATPQFGQSGLALICCRQPCGSRIGLALWLDLRMRMAAGLRSA